MKILEYDEPDINFVKNVNRKELIELINNKIKIDTKKVSIQKPLFIYGATGIGKSSILQETCWENNVNVIKIECGNFEVNFNEKQNLFMRNFNWLSKELYHIEKDKVVVLFFHDVYRLEERYINNFMQFVNSRKFEDFILPDNVVIICTSLKQKDTGIKVIHLEKNEIFKPTFEWVNFALSNTDWLEWAVEENIKIKNDNRWKDYPIELRYRILPEIISFIGSDSGSNSLYEIELRQGGFSPFIWDHVSRELKWECEDNNYKSIIEISDEDIRLILVGNLPSKKTLTNFIEYINFLRKNTNIKQNNV